MSLATRHARRRRAPTARCMLPPLQEAEHLRESFTCRFSKDEARRSRVFRGNVPLRMSVAGGESAAATPACAAAPRARRGGANLSETPRNSTTSMASLASRSGLVPEEEIVPRMFWASYMPRPPRLFK
jgi:hypothetical protein